MQNILTKWLFLGHERSKKRAFTFETLYRLSKALHLEKEMGEGLGQSALLL
jgi:hypothetical protein